MSDNGQCSRCGLPLASAPAGLCPRCLLETAVAVERGPHLHVRCPHCHHPIEIVETAPLTEIACPSCDSVFSLAGDETVTYPESSAVAIGRFQLLDRVGTGAFGTVWKARDPELDRLVALKVPRKGQLLPAEAEQFLREARAAAQLRHPGIVSVHEVGRSGETVYIVSDYVDGITLADWLSAKRPSPREAAELCSKIAQALSHAHEMGIVHRDLKPSNVMLDAHGQPHVMDFGLAKREAGEITMTVEGHVLGTPAYMSPEQARGDAHQADRRTDVYSLGVMLFELLTGEKPFRGSPRMLLHQVLHDDPPAPRKLSSAIPRDLETICLKCLEKEPSRRYASAGDLADDLQRFLKGEPVAARPAGRWERGVKWSRRRPATAALVGVSGLALVAIAAGAVAIAALNARAYSEAVGRQKAESAKLEAERQRRVDAEDRARAESSLRKQAEQERNAKSAALRRMHGLRLLNDSNGLLTENPTRALLLAIAAAERAPGLQTTNALYAAMDASLEERTLTGFPVRTAQFSRDGKRIVLGCEDQVGRIVDADTGKLLVTLDGGHLSSVSAAEFSDDGKLVLTVSMFDRRTCLWNSETGRRLCTLVHPGFEDRGHNTGEHVTAHFSADGTKVVTTCAILPDVTARVWDALSGTERFVIKGHQGLVRSARFSPDSTKVVTASQDKTARIVDVASGAASSLPHPDGVEDALFSPDSKRVLTLGDNTNWIYAKSVDGKLELKGSVSSSSMYDHLAGRVWEVETGKFLFGLNWPIDSDGQVPTAAFSPDGKWIATAAATNGTMFEPCLWDAHPGKLHTELKGHNSDVRKFDDANTVAFSADSRSLLTVYNDGVVCLRRLPDGQIVRTLRGPGITGAAFSPDGQHVLSVNADGTASLWESGREEVHPGFPVSWRRGRLPGGSAVFLPTGNRIFTEHHGRGRIWELSTGRELATLEGAEGHTFDNVVFSTDGSRVLAVVTNPVRETTAQPVRVWNTASGTLVAAFDGPSDRVRSASLSADGRRAAAAGGQNAVVWNVDTKAVLCRLTNPDRREDPPDDSHLHQPLNFCRFSPNGQVLLTLSDPDTLGGTPKANAGHLWNAETGKHLAPLAFAEPQNSGLCDFGMFTPDGRRILASSRSGSPNVRVFDAATGREFPEPQKQNGQTVRFSTDGTLVAMSSGNWVTVLETSSGKERCHLTAVAAGPIEAMAFDPPGRKLLVGTEMGARVWDLASKTELASFPHESRFTASTLAFSPDGRWALTGSGGQSRLWPLDPLSVARRLAPRQLTAAEKKDYGVEP